MDEKKKIEWADTAHEKEWVIDGYEVKAKHLKDALMVEVRYRMPLYAAVLEDQQDDEHEFEHEKEYMISELEDGEEEPSDDSVWERVWDTRSMWCDEAFFDITGKNASLNTMLEAVNLTWDSVEFNGIECEGRWCEEVVDVDSGHLCPSCDYYFCQECLDDDEDGECPGCGYVMTALDAWRRAVEDGVKEAA
jgi:hypothetical protein